MNHVKGDTAMTPVISVIIPVYKVEQYLPKCIESVCNQTFRNLEIILIDDGSPDNCGKICDEYAARDSRIRVIHKENGGVSTARNAGLKAASGELIGFVDSDDWIEPDAFEFLYNNLIKEDADISLCSAYEHRGEQVNVLHCPVTNAILSGQDALKVALQSPTIGFALWNKLFRRHIISDVHFPVGHVWEDAFIMMPLIDKANKIAFNLQPKFHYQRRPGSITLSRYNPSLRDMTNSKISIHEYILEKYPALSQITLYDCLKDHLSMLNLMLTTSLPVDKAHKKEVIDFLIQHKKQIYKNPLISNSEKLMVFLLGIHVLLYKAFLRIYLPSTYQAYLGIDQGKIK